ncbi:MAG TPA: amidohydrolase family protein [Vicinamibacterales bacterium]|nr:amidohydrolase family protein [Vicinamibacterales bacterium]
MHDKIALEEHFATDETVRESPEFGHAGEWSALERRLLDLGDERLREMDATGIAFAILSLNAPGVQSVFDAKKSVAVARRANDALAAGIAKHPDRFGGFAALPMQDPEAACVELRRAVTHLGFKGAMANGFSQVGDASRIIYYDDPIYAPFWSTVAALDVPFYLHPRDPLPERTTFYDGHPWLRGAAWAFGVETATHALRLMASGIFDAHPRLTVILGHLGEGLPYNIWRVDHRFGKRPRVMPPVKRKFSEYLRDNFYVTTSGSFHTQTLHSAIAEMGVDRVLFSVDYPFEDCGQAAAWFDGCDLSREALEKIGSGNAAQLFGLK